MPFSDCSRRCIVLDMRVSKSSSPFEQVYEIVQKIPKGSVLTYGAISKLMGRRLSAAAVGWALRALPSASSNGEVYLGTA